MKKLKYSQDTINPVKKGVLTNFVSYFSRQNSQPQITRKLQQLEKKKRLLDKRMEQAEELMLEMETLRLYEKELEREHIIINKKIRLNEQQEQKLGLKEENLNTRQLAIQEQIQELKKLNRHEKISKQELIKLLDKIK